MASGRAWIHRESVLTTPRDHDFARQITDHFDVLASLSSDELAAAVAVGVRAYVGAEPAKSMQAIPPPAHETELLEAVE